VHHLDERKQAIQEYQIKLYQRPGFGHEVLVQQVRDIAVELTNDWFTPDVPKAIPKDLMFQDCLCLEIENRVVSFMTFTSNDGQIEITLMGTKLSARGNGFGSKLMEYFLEHAVRIGFDQVQVWTVAPSSKPIYISTIKFYQKHGFIIERECPNLWQSGPALKLIRNLDVSKVAGN
jgi:N-acetylglutamate synthase-like GNAT family acetyltransferase